MMKMNQQIHHCHSYWKMGKPDTEMIDLMTTMTTVTRHRQHLFGEESNNQNRLATIVLTKR
jgi:hypothetical protein